MSLLDIFATAILPIVAIAAVGFALGRVKAVDPGPLNTAVVYVLAPALVFHSLAATALDGGTLLKLTVGVTAFIIAMVVVAEVAARLLGFAEPARSALVLVSTFPNCGNYGIPVSAFAFGAVGRSAAVVYLAVQAVLIYTVGVYVASRSGGKGGLAGVKRVFRIPLIYAVVLALLARWLGVVPPVDGTTMQTLQLVGDASIPVMLLILGIQLADTDYAAAFAEIGAANVLKMGVAPVVAAAIAIVIGFPNADVGRVFILESAMPAAITPLILLIEFAGEAKVGDVTVPEYVSTVVLTSTLLSIPLLTVLISLLKAGVVV